MKTALEQLTKYASYHRDPRNIITHFIGIPLIVFAVVVLLARPVLINALPSSPYANWLLITPALIAIVLVSLYYLKLDVQLGLVMTGFLVLCYFLSVPLARNSLSVWLFCGLGIFALGWVLQFVGHFYEGKKPAFIDDIMGLIIGPLFVAAEAAFLLNLRADLRKPIENAVGPTRRNTRTTAQ